MSTARHRIVASRPLSSRPEDESRRYTCACGVAIDAHPDVFPEAWAFHTEEK